MDSLKRLYHSSYYSFKGTFGFLKPQIYFLVNVVNPVFQVIFFSLIATHAYGSGNIAPYVLGNSFILCSINAFFGVGCVLIEERSLGTLKNILASPCSKFIHFISKSLFHILDGGLTVIIGFIVGIVFFKLIIPVSSIPLLAVILLTAMFSACGMGLLIGSIGLVTRDINLLLNLSSMSLMALCGVNFPVERLPKALQFVSNILPLTHSLKAARELLNIEPASESILKLILIEFAVGICFYLAAFITLKVMEQLAKRNATIELF